MTNSPAMTSVSLLAERYVLALEDRVIGRNKPGRSGYSRYDDVGVRVSGGLDYPRRSTDHPGAVQTAGEL